MKIVLLFVFSFYVFIAQAQFIKELRFKKNAKTLATYRMGDAVTVFVLDKPLTGYITWIKQDTIYVNRYAIALSEITHMPKKQRPKKKLTVANLGLTTLGVGITAAGIYLSNQENLGTAIGYASIIGYGGLAVDQFTNLFRGRKKIKLNSVYRLQILDI